MSSSKTRQKRRAETEYDSFTLADVLGETSAFTTQSLSADRRRTHTTTHEVELPSPVKKKARIVASRPNLFADVGDGFEYVFDDLAAPPSPIRQSSGAGVKPRAKRYLSSDWPLREWTPLQDEYLAEFVRLNGRGDTATSRTCFARVVSCEPTPVTPWTALSCGMARFRRVSLKTLGLRVQLGHYGQTCNTPIPAHKNFMVIHTNGMHKVGVDFCGCVDEEIVGSRVNSFSDGKVTTYDFYSGLEKLTDNSGLRKMKDRYKGFMRTMREWRHLAMLKRGGRGNDGDRLVAETRPGELAVVCPACPQPGVNLPADWESASGEERFLYILYIAIDACFRLKADSSQAGHTSRRGPFRTFLLSVTDQKEMSTCSGLAALDYANTKFRWVGLLAWDWVYVLAMSSCSVTAQRICRKGRGHTNMDYILGSLLRHHYWRLRKYLSYDICCQWSKYLIERMKEMPNGIKLNLILSLLRFVIPKLHIYGHKLACQLNFSLNYTPGAGRTDGEGIERPWANIGVATSTREMGPGSRQDTLNDHWGHWNWQNSWDWRDSLATFTENQGEHVEEWVAMVLAFEADGTSPNPYELPKSGANEHDVRLECVEEEAAEQERGVLPINNVSPSAFIIAGLDLEEQQSTAEELQASHQSRFAIAQKSESSKNSADVVRAARSWRYVVRFRKLQAVYMPGALQALADRPVAGGKREAC
ncbi:hypothetical protein B0H14DRAFT_2648615 [Mycena olivaceomarginata]|nr:hypothetical protein B0H14DRAFT_2648615 [Mycena olivaceomarginata]